MVKIRERKKVSLTSKGKTVPSFSSIAMIAVMSSSPPLATDGEIVTPPSIKVFLVPPSRSLVCRQLKRGKFGYEPPYYNRISLIFMQNKFTALLTVLSNEAAHATGRPHMDNSFTRNRKNRNSPFFSNNDKILGLDDEVCCTLVASLLPPRRQDTRRIILFIATPRWFFCVSSASTLNKLAL